MSDTQTLLYILCQTYTNRYSNIEEKGMEKYLQVYLLCLTLIICCLFYVMHMSIGVATVKRKIWKNIYKNKYFLHPILKFCCLFYVRHMQIGTTIAKINIIEISVIIFKKITFLRLIPRLCCLFQFRHMSIGVATVNILFV